MHHYTTLVPPIRATGAAPYGIATPSQPVDHKKAPMVPASRLAGRVHAAPAAAMPQAAPAVQSNPKMPGLQHLPRFQPPTFEGLNGILPCPDSPGSTPRDDEEEMPSREEDQHQQFLAPSIASSVSRTKESNEVVEKEKPAPFAVGSFVEYKSRSSGLWILAKVESFDEANNSYRLDVQPHAHADRVRARTPHSGSGTTDHEREARRERNGGRDRERDSDVGRDREQLCEGDFSRERDAARDHGRDRETGRDIGREYEGRNERDACEMPVPSNVEPLAQGGVSNGYPVILHSAPETALEQLSAAESLSPVLEIKSRGNGDLSLDLSQADPVRLIAEVDALRQQVARLQSDNARLQADKQDLQDRLRQETSLKDRYFSEVCSCHDQLQRNKGTPR